MTEQLTPGDHLPPSPEIPIDQLLVEVYTSAAPAVQSSMLSKLVGKVYQSAAPDERGLLIRLLMQPLGILSLLAVANGVFAKLRLQGGLSGMSSRLEDVQVDDVVELASFAQQVSEQALHSVVQWLSASPVLVSSAAAAILVKILMDRAAQRHEGDRRSLARI
jgi:hypothetical protein